MDRSTPAQVGDDSNWATITAGDLTTCGTRTDMTQWCWGSNVYGQVGDGTTAKKRLSPKQVGGGTTWTGGAVGTGHSCAVRTDGTAWCWGSNLTGQLGNGTTEDSSTPVRVKRS
ncbi:MAG: hypothetical protein H0U61_06925 [Nocardioidaceae bacterium]|nr:hypothetical protein [Nocardioidaceae bacterium]